MMTFQEPKLEIAECDNGWVVEWSKERFSMPEEGKPPPRGVRIFTSKKALVEFVTEFFASK